MNQATTAWLGLILATHVIAILLTSDKQGSNVIETIGLGILAGQVTLIAICAAMLQGRRRMRIPILFGLTLLGTSAIYFFEWLQDVSSERPFMYPACTIISFASLGTAAAIARWSLVAPWVEISFAPRVWQFRLRQLLVGFTLLAIVFAYARHVIFTHDISIALGDKNFQLLIPIACVAINAILFAIPCICAVYLPDRTTIDSRITVGAFVALLVHANLLSCMEIFVLTGGSGFHEYDWYVAFIFNSTQCVAIFSTVLALRIIGFRLIRARAMENETTPDDIQTRP